MELLAVVLILGVIAAIVVPRVASSGENAKQQVCEHNCGQINSAIERYYIDTGTWPSPDLNELNNVAGTYFPDGLPTCAVTGTPYRIDLSSPEKHVVGHTNGNHTP